MGAPIDHMFASEQEEATNVVLNAEVKSEMVASKWPSVDELRRALPKHCTEISLTTSTYYLLRDYAAIAFLYLIVPYVEYYGGFVGLWIWYCIQGLFMSALFLIGHECVHGLFAEQNWINIVAGHLSLAPILIPYYPWEKTHRMHHTHTYHIEKDKGHPWVEENDYKTRNWFVQHFCAIPISAFFRFHMYMFLGLPDGSHFNPLSELLKTNKERFLCLCSGLASAFSVYIAYLLCGQSWFVLFKYYYVPLAFQNFWLVMVTYLNHQDDDVEVYEPDTWKYMPAQMQTIDRYFGFGIDHILHHASDAHVVHHIFFTKIPHYHLMDATNALVPILEKYNGVYKRKSCYNYLFEFLRLNIRLEYLVGKGTGTLRYPKTKST
ncbi:Omega-6 fatty acid desaturase, endoplasmic reticulum isozyme 1 [Aphelenchoides besseyi]|nr:Omega-6 fatty acid desaturase, endoplasmic reticulum isozyme 1 [Aphelenchoides besseyi]